jgi:hypothetical protein
MMGFGGSAENDVERQLEAVRHDDIEHDGETAGQAPAEIDPNPARHRGSQVIPPDTD